MAATSNRIYWLRDEVRTYWLCGHHHWLIQYSVLSSYEQIWASMCFVAVVVHWKYTYFQASMDVGLHKCSTVVGLPVYIEWLCQDPWPWLFINSFSKTLPIHVSSFLRVVTLCFEATACNTYYLIICLHLPQCQIAAIAESIGVHLLALLTGVNAATAGKLLCSLFALCA